MEMMSQTGPQTKTAKFRQSGWKEKATGIIQEYYGTDMPPQDGTFVKLWDNVITQVSTSTPFTDPAPEVVDTTCSA